jgi:2-oxoglutarate dehydrogenase E2 component (dihydrolipoamide succinyltransferase)
MPQLGETVTEGTITRWMKSVGDQVTRDEPLFEVSTDKVDSEVPAPASGVLTEILVPEGETVEVGVRLAVIGEAGVEPAAPPAATPTAAPAPAPGDSQASATEPWVAAAPEPPPAPPPPPPPGYAAAAPPPPPPPPPPARPMTGFSSSAIADFAALAGQGQARTPADDTRLLSPVVRRLLADSGIDPATVPGTGLGGRITREDVLAVIDARRHAQAAEQAEAAPAPAPAPAAVPGGLPASS